MALIVFIRLKGYCSVSEFPCQGLCLRLHAAVIVEDILVLGAIVSDSAAGIIFEVHMIFLPILLLPHSVMAERIVQEIAILLSFRERAEMQKQFTAGKEENTGMPLE